MDLASQLVGTWKGAGKGEFPTIEPFEYEEEVVFARPPNKPFLSYVQKTKSKTGSPMHTESGFLRVFEDGVCEFCIAQPTGLCEIEQGKIERHADGSIRWDSQAGQETTQGDNMIRGERTKEPGTFMVVRRFKLVGDVLSYNLLMATSTTPKLTHHLSATLEKQQ